MAVKVTGQGIRAGAATKKVVVCKECGHKTAVAIQAAGKVRCGGCGSYRRAGR
jgi:DNA-directed RNA polymerase subunit RPC12/RpoP